MYAISQEDESDCESLHGNEREREGRGGDSIEWDGQWRPCKPQRERTADAHDAMNREPSRMFPRGR